jgi:hypothetical protein
MTILAFKNKIEDNIENVIKLERSNLTSLIPPNSSNLRKQKVVVGGN